MKKLAAFAAVFLFLLSLSVPADAQPAVTLSATALPSNLPAGFSEPVGTSILWTAAATNVTSPAYRFSVQLPDGTIQVVQDFSQFNTLQWSSLQEGTYVMMVAVVDMATGGSAVRGYPLTFKSRVTGGSPVVSSTVHPLVALYSAPPCSVGSVTVTFHPAAGGMTQTTPPQNCQPGLSLNFYIAGMTPNTKYVLQQQTNVNGVVSQGPVRTFQTGSLPFTPPLAIVSNRPDLRTSQEGILLSSFVATLKANGPIATDLNGNVLWYDPAIFVGTGYQQYLARPVPGGDMLMIVRTNNYLGQRLQEIDLAGNIVRATNVSAVDTQLAAQGKDVVSWFNHDAFRLPNGHTLVLGSVEKILTNVQGPGPVDVVGDMIIDLDQNFQVSWTWNPFNWMDTSRKAVLGETCSRSNFDCNPLRLAPVANDWMHSNSVFYLPSDGNLLLSVRHQDWVLKIDYENGHGSGQILWRLGRGGDFALAGTGTDPWPWFSHQHDVSFNNGLLTLFDNGNTRIAETGPGNSRGQVWKLDETSMTATRLLSVDLGTYSLAYGSAAQLSNGDFHFLSGCIHCDTANLFSWADQSLEVFPNGSTDYGIIFPFQAYRSFRLNTMYSYKP